MTTLSKEGFLKHCVSMGDADIDNRRWSTCAVGTYLESLGIIVADERDLVRNLVSDEHSEGVDTFMGSFSAEIRHSLNHGEFYTYEDLARCLAGELNND